MLKNKKIEKLIFLHHSCGANWLRDDNGGLGIALKDNNYFVSDTYYGWGPNNIGDRTDIGNWWEWFCGPNSKEYMDAVYSESNSSLKYTRLSSEPRGENTIIMFKSCYPNSNVKISDGIIPNIILNPLKNNESDTKYHTVENAKGIYIELLEYFKTMQDKLFIAVTAPPVQEKEYSANARKFNNWLANKWLEDYLYKNVGVFNLFDVLTGGKGDTLLYPSSNEDNHPNNNGNKKATEKFIPLLKDLQKTFNEGKD